MHLLNSELLEAASHINVGSEHNIYISQIKLTSEKIAKEKNIPKSEIYIRLDLLRYCRRLHLQNEYTTRNKE